MPDWEHVFWTDKDIDEIILKQQPKYADLYHSYYHDVSRNDMARCLILQSYGGLYADLDVEMMSTIEPEFKSTEGIWIPYWRHPEFAVMASMPGHPFLERALEVMLERDPKLKFYNFDYDIIATTGPGAVQHAYNTFSLKDVVENKEGMSSYKGREIALWKPERYLFGADMTPEQVRTLGEPIAHHYFAHEYLWRTKKNIFRSIGFGLIMAYALVALFFVLKNQVQRKRAQGKMH